MSCCTKLFICTDLIKKLHHVFTPAIQRGGLLGPKQVRPNREMQISMCLDLKAWSNDQVYRCIGCKRAREEAGNENSPENRMS